MTLRNRSVVKRRKIFEEEPVKDRRGEHEEMGGRGSAVEEATRRGSKISFGRTDIRADGEDDEGECILCAYN